MGYARVRRFVHANGFARHSLICQLKFSSTGCFQNLLYINSLSFFKYLGYWNDYFCSRQQTFSHKFWLYNLLSWIVFLLKACFRSLMIFHCILCWTIYHNVDLKQPDKRKRKQILETRFSQIWLYLVKNWTEPKVFVRQFFATFRTKIIPLKWVKSFVSNIKK